MKLNDDKIDKIFCIGTEKHMQRLCCVFVNFIEIKPKKIELEMKFNYAIR